MLTTNDDCVVVYTKPLNTYLIVYLLPYICRDFELTVVPHQIRARSQRYISVHNSSKYTIIEIGNSAASAPQQISQLRIL